ncbi:MAG: NAD-binding protein [Phycisphaerae bacterium]
MHTESNEHCLGVYRHGQVELTGPVDWPSGSHVVVSLAEPSGESTPAAKGSVIIAGFGLGGRYVADLLDHSELDYVVVEQNPVTVETQACLGRRIILGNIASEETLQEAGVRQASILALTVPDEQAVLSAIVIARRLNPDLYIIARTTYTSSGLQAIQRGADDVIKAEQAVALQFHQRLRRILDHPVHRSPAPRPTDKPAPSC